ncbi:hypothetical protein HNQ07_001846 [Deinococcus metalli]|uniref:DUF2171 domain-containing protein n=1 Tax=Deinococcus metalli TaxID=1141878 RepID=A0A7W8KDX2_9DEIO|nr:DUF2171 domain-containing protein [Deinococcus metalli]MBB5376382.1 hypothetical protein [Deinococcus metalli]GHF44466.1 hypothetical protein GCM10017781_21220 [Deinococcus metalli]
MTSPNTPNAGDPVPTDPRIQPGMAIICSDGTVYGLADGTEREYLRTAPTVDNRRHFIPLSEVARVEDAVYLRLDHRQLLEIL